MVLTAPGLLLAAGFKAGVATAVITPTEPTWLGGYGSRTEPADGKIHDLNCKVLALQDEAGYAVVLITLDTENVPRAFAEGIAKDLISESKTAKGIKLTREQIVVSCAHTHCGPGLASADAQIIYPMTPAQYALTERYTAWLQKKSVETALKAIDAFEPAELTYGNGTCGFGVNRRNNKEAETGKPGFVPVGPVDHDVPVLCVRTDGKLRAVLFGYACHCTTMNFQKWCGDWAGFAKLDVEAKNPGVTALFMTGCGADTNPLPRRKLELCEDYGRQLADSVEKVLGGSLHPIHGSIKASITHVDLPFESIPSRTELEANTTTKPATRARWAKYLLKELDRDGKLPTSYSYGVQAIHLGDGPLMVVLSGEVVVDYSLRLKRELGREHTWVFAYCNDVCAYMPSERVLKEGGYEGRDSMVIYGHPSAWAAGLEAKIVGAVRRVAGE